MLSKVDGWLYKDKILASNTEEQNASYWSKTFLTYTTTKTANYTLKCEAKKYNNGSTFAYTTLSVIDVDNRQHGDDLDTSYTLIEEIFENVVSGKELRISGGAYSNWNGVYVKNCYIIEKEKFIEIKDKIRGIPKEIKEIWNQIQTIIYWKNTIDLYHGWIMLEKSTTATTGSITLGNAVGFIKVNLNWEIVKIPYYWN